ncbi:MAG: FtsQ-type POTRA domain-containing protein [Clostridia bacterium]|nr:FtsQ-type POTRA domain-containing protein [Clostridia bacterium]
MKEQRRAPQKRKIPLKQRIAIAIVQTVEERENSKRQKAQPKTQPQSGRRPAPTGRTQQRAPQQRPQTRPQNAPQTGGSRRAPLTPEQRRRRAQQVRRVRRRRQAIRIAAAVILSLFVFLILSRTVLFKIRDIEVTNPADANYTKDQIVTASGVTFGAQNLFTCDLKKTAKNIEQYLPYIGKAQVQRDFPKTLRVTVTPTKASAAIALGTSYLLIDADGKMLENTSTAPDSVPVLRCKTEFEPTLGQYIGVPASGKKADEKMKAAASMIELYKKIYAALEEAQIDDITFIDIRDVRAITLMYQNRLTLHLGDEEKLEQKLKSAAKTIAVESDASKARTGAIDLTTIPWIYSHDTYTREDGETVTGVSEPESTTEEES